MGLAGGLHRLPPGVPLGRTNATLVDLGLFVVFAIVCIGLNLTHGFAGKISLAQAGFLGIGAYVPLLLDTGSHVAVAGLERRCPTCPSSSPSPWPD